MGQCTHTGPTHHRGDSIHTQRSQQGHGYTALIAVKVGPSPNRILIFSAKYRQFAYQLFNNQSRWTTLNAARGRYAGRWYFIRVLHGSLPGWRCSRRGLPRIAPPSPAGSWSVPRAGSPRSTPSQCTACPLNQYSGRLYQHMLTWNYRKMEKNIFVKLEKKMETKIRIFFF